MYSKEEMESFVRFPAIQGGYTPFLLIKDNKVIGKGRWTSGKDGFYSVQFPKELLKEIVSEEIQKEFDFYKLDISMILLRFSQYSGEFTEIWPVCKASYDDMLGLRVIEQYVFEMGIGSISFKQIEGYGKGKINA